MRRDLQRFASDTSGATAIEYGLIASLIACVLIASFQTLGLEIYKRLNGMAEVVGQAGS
jgi:pilus assembly protein Flp/PilA